MEKPGKKKRAFWPLAQIKSFKKENTAMFNGLMVSLVYFGIGVFFGLIMRNDAFPKALQEYGNYIVFLFIPIAGPIADFKYEQGEGLSNFIFSLLGGFVVFWVLITPLYSLFLGIIRNEK